MYIFFFIDILVKQQPIRHGLNFDHQKSVKVWDLWFHIGSIRFHCPRVCFDWLIQVNNSRCSSKHCLCLHHCIGLLSTWYGVFIVPKDSQWWNWKIVPRYKNSAINASWELLTQGKLIVQAVLDCIRIPHPYLIKVVLVLVADLDSP